MKYYPSLAKIVFALALTAVIIGFSAFRQKQKSATYSFRKEQPSRDEDTTHKRNRDGADRDFYKIEGQMKQLEMQMQKLEDQMKKLDMSRYEKEMNETMKNIDLEKITEQIDKSMKDVDWERISKDAAENARNMSKLGMEDVKKQMEQVNATLQKQKFNLQIDAGKMRANIERAMKNAHMSLESAREEIKNLKEFTDALEKDGLIDKSKAYKIEVKDAELYIDGKKQSKETSDKYKKYYRKNNFTINMNEGDNDKSEGDDVRI